MTFESQSDLVDISLVEDNAGDVRLTKKCSGIARSAII